MGFVPLHNHSDYSLLDGASQLPLMVKRAKELGMPALALTDHGVMYGAIELLKLCKEANIKPINKDTLPPCIILDNISLPN